MNNTDFLRTAEEAKKNFLQLAKAISVKKRDRTFMDESRELATEKIELITPKLNSLIKRSKIDENGVEYDIFQKALSAHWLNDLDSIYTVTDSLDVAIKLVAGNSSDKAVDPIAIGKFEKDLNSIFIVHGHDGEIKERIARFIERLGLTAIILHEQVGRSQTIIEKIEKHSNVGFAIVLYTPDDLGNIKLDAQNGQLESRARQNVIFEHGYLLGKIGRENVVVIVSGSIELPNDISGVVYISERDWQVSIAKEIKDAGYEIDFNKLL